MPSTFDYHAMRTKEYIEKAMMSYTLSGMADNLDRAWSFAGMALDVSTSKKERDFVSILIRRIERVNN